MAETPQPAVLPRQGARKQTAVAALTALGIVYGDIGTSTLYGLKQAVEAGGTPTPDTVKGIVSVILWSILLIVALKYAILILRADKRRSRSVSASRGVRSTARSHRSPCSHRHGLVTTKLRRRVGDPVRRREPAKARSRSALRRRRPGRPGSAERWSSALSEAHE